MYDLEERTLNFSIETRKYVGELPKTLKCIEDMKQLLRSSGSIGANYIEANEALSKKDFIHRIKISRKEAKETTYWIKVIIASNQLNPVMVTRGQSLLSEAEQLRKILSAILIKAQK